MALADPIIEEFEWLEQAACKGTDPGLFFPDGTTTPDAQEKIEEAKAVCYECASKIKCLSYAISSNQDSGIWGGTSEIERRQIRRDLKHNRITEDQLFHF